MWPTRWQLKQRVQAGVTWSPRAAHPSGERWNQDTCDPGMNGESQMILAGDLTTWYFKYLAGIGYDPQQPGFKHIILRPQPVGDLLWVRAFHVSLYGKIVSRWRIEGSEFHWAINIPPNTTATVYVPAKKRRCHHRKWKARCKLAGFEIPPQRKRSRGVLRSLGRILVHVFSVEMMVADVRNPASTEFAESWRRFRPC